MTYFDIPRHVVFPHSFPFSFHFCLAVRHYCKSSDGRTSRLTYCADLVLSIPSVVTRSLRWQRASPPSRPKPGHSIQYQLSQHGSRLSFSMENRSFDDAGPTPQIQGESSIFYYWLVKASSRNVFSQSIPRDLLRTWTDYLGQPSTGFRIFSPPVACPSTTCYISHKAYQSFHVVSPESFVGVEGGSSLPIRLDRRRPSATFLITRS